MSWIRIWKHRGRFAILVLAGTAIVGPWTFERFWVPSDLLCSPPYFRLDQDYCGIPLSGLYLFEWIFTGFCTALREAWAGGGLPSDQLRELVLMLLFLLILLPLATSSVILLRGNSRIREKIHITAWALSASMALFIAVHELPHLFLQVWGIWLFIALAICALILELSTGHRSRNPS